MQITKSQKKKIFRISFTLTCFLGLVPSITQGDEWPSGSYGLPKPKSGCPGGQKNGWRDGWRYQDMQDNKKSSEWSRVSNGSRMLFVITITEYNDRDVNRTFCMKQSTGIQARFWPKGSYCLYKNGMCPTDMRSGWVYWDDENYLSRNKHGGFLPDGVYNENTKIYYCCQTDGNWYDLIELPVSQPFYLLTSNSADTPKCQIVKWAFSYLEYIVFDTEDSNNKDAHGGEHLFLDGRKLFYCYYEACRRTITGLSGSFRSHKIAVSEMDPRSQYCSWLITLAETYIVALSFKELTIPSCKDTFLRIYDGSNNTAPLLGTYCGSNARAEIVVLSSTNSLYIVSNSGSYERSPKNTFTFHAQYNATNSTATTPGGNATTPSPTISSTTTATTPGGNTTTPSPATSPTTTATSTPGGNRTTPSPATPTDSRPTFLPDSSTKKVDTKSNNGILSELDKKVDDLYRKNVSDEVRKKVATKVIDDLLNVTNFDKMDKEQREKGIDPQNITIIARILQQIVHLNISDNNLNILGPASNILDIRNTKSWRNMTNNKVIRDLVITLEDYGFLYGENLKNISNTSLIVKDYPNVQLNLEYIKYAGNLSPEKRLFKFPNASFKLSPDALLKESGAVVVILWYKTIHSLIRNTFHGDNIYAAISSKIITVNVRPEQKKKFSEPVRISWDLAELNDSKTCAYWKPRSGENRWKTDGCKKVTDKFYSNRLICECDHLTAFAAMDISRIMLSKDERKALEIISTIGCSVSLVGVILTILIYALFWKRLHRNSKSKVPSQVLMHLCVVIGMADIFAILAGPALKYKTFCIAVSILLYFFVLALFGWMLCEGIIIYLQLVKVFSGMGLGGKHLKRFYLIGWGIPVVVVSVLVGVNDREDFITEGACWCGGDGVLFWVFVGALGLIILVNLVIFILALRNTLSNWEVTSTSTQGSETSTKATVCTKLTKAKIGLKGSAVLLPILGLTWVFGLLVFNRDATVFKYLFAIFNSLQGLMIFVFHVLINKKIQEEIIRERKARNAGQPTKTKPMANTTYVTSLTNEETTGNSRIPVPEDIELSQHSDHQT